MAPGLPRDTISPAQQQQQQQQQRREDQVAEPLLEDQLTIADPNGPTHHPSAPLHELFDIQTTVDPSYIISLIRKLLPDNGRQGDDAQGHRDHSENGRMEDNAMSPKRNVDPNDSNGHLEAMVAQHDDLEQFSVSSERPMKSVTEEAWEESGCILWDLAANKEHAEFMVENHMLGVLVAILMTSDSARITEISLGIIGNLACHEVLMNRITSTDRLLETVVDQVFSDNTPCLCEVCRLLTLGLQGCQRVVWAKALQSENTLSRVLWIADNALNPILIEKTAGLFLAILENQQEVAPILLPTLMNLGLQNRLVNMFAFEMGKVTRDRMPDRYLALDSILRTIEALSVTDGYSDEICSNREVAQMAVELIKIPEKIEISSSCVTAVVLIANILADTPDLASEMSKDLLLLQSLLDLLPLTSDDFEARNALWSILARLLVRVKEMEIGSLGLSEYVCMLVGRSDLIEDVLLDCQWDRSSEQNEMLTSSEEKSTSRTAAIRCILNILNQWNLVQNEISVEHKDDDPVNNADDRDVQKLLDCCLKHVS